MAAKTTFNNYVPPSSLQMTPFPTPPPFSMDEIFKQHGVAKTKEGGGDTTAKVKAAAAKWIKGPTGKEMPVAEPDAFYDEERKRFYYDHNDRVIMQGRVPTNVFTDGKSSRAVHGIDYALFGMVKIGDIWVDPSNEKNVKKATEIAKAQSCCARCCVIL